MKVPQLAAVLRGPPGIISVANQIVPSIASSERDLLHAMVVTVEVLLVGKELKVVDHGDLGARCGPRRLLRRHGEYVDLARRQRQRH